MPGKKPLVFTIGHSTRSLEELVALLRKFDVKRLIADALIVRGYEVRDIMSLTSAKEHKLSPMAKVEGTSITYPSEETSAH